MAQTAPVVAGTVTTHSQPVARMQKSPSSIDQGWWFKLVVIILAVASAVALFRVGGIGVYEHGVLSARTLLFFFCWFGLERVYTGLIWGLIAWLRPAWTGSE